MQEMQVQSLGWEDPLEKEMATHSSILAWRNPLDRGAQSMKSQKITTQLESKQHFIWHSELVLQIIQINRKCSSANADL